MNVINFSRAKIHFTIPKQIQTIPHYDIHCVIAVLYYCAHIHQKGVNYIIYNLTKT